MTSGSLAYVVLLKAGEGRRPQVRTGTFCYCHHGLGGGALPPPPPVTVTPALGPRAVPTETEVKGRRGGRCKEEAGGNEEEEGGEKQTGKKQSQHEARRALTVALLSAEAKQLQNPRCQSYVGEFTSRLIGDVG